VAAGLDGSRASTKAERVRAGSDEGRSGTCTELDGEWIAASEGLGGFASSVRFASLVPCADGWMRGEPAAEDGGEAWVGPGAWPAPEGCAGPAACSEPGDCAGLELRAELEAWAGTASAGPECGAGSATTCVASGGRPAAAPPIASEGWPAAAALGTSDAWPGPATPGASDGWPGHAGPATSEGCPQAAAWVASEGWGAVAATGASGSDPCAASRASPGGEAGWRGVTRTRAGVPT